MKFYDAYFNRPKVVGEQFDDEKLVETGGFISTKKRVENMIISGQNLMLSRNEAFDFPNGEDDGREIDPVRVLRTDPADVSQSLQKLQESLTESARLAAETRSAIGETSQKSSTKSNKVDEQNPQTV